MNLALSDPFALAQEYPESLQYKLKSGHSTCIRFNWKGDILASGRLDGVVVLFDMETKALAQILRGHVRQIQSLSWSTSGRYLLSASQDWKAILWDLQDGSRLRSVRFDSPIYIAEIHPHNHFLFVASLYEDSPHLVDLTDSIRPRKHPLPTAPRRPATADTEEGEIDEKRAAQDAKQLTTATVFTSNGRYIIAGTNKGWINIISVDTKETVSSTRLTNGCITYIRLTGSGRDMVVNANDRVLRTVQVPAALYTPAGKGGGSGASTPPSMVDEASLHLEVEHKFQDVVNRLLWNHCAFSPTGEYMTASTYKNHDIYIWERTVGSLVKILEGPKEELGVVEWHPTFRPLVAAVGLETGGIFVWANEVTQKWSALAPDFEEVEENVEYVEREDEFDVHPREEVKRRRMQVEDEPVDVFGDGEGDGGNEDGEEQEEWRMPVILGLEKDDTDSEGSGSPRRRSPGVEGGGGGGGGVGGGTPVGTVVGGTRAGKTTKKRKLEG
ncbi:WD40-repeat-containing domain protein [Kalaharituber pfeilii]|nr:WD40-repeat-containing domain protein [Kalaharituber pfeilii]